MAGWLLVLHAGATFYMLGVIWFVQVVHYPLMHRVPPDGFCTFSRDHQRLTTWVVAPGMLVELATAVGLVVLQPHGLAVWSLWAGLGLIVVIWLSTAVWQVPCHRSLERSYALAVHRRLVWTNWARTVAWSLRGFLVGWWLIRTLSV